MRSPMTDNDALLRALGRQSRRERRERVAEALAVVKAAKRAGLPVKGATVEGVALTFGAPDAPAAGGNAEFNEWDRDLGTNPPSLRQ
jgi:hypothetical protein